MQFVVKRWECMHLSNVQLTDRRYLRNNCCCHTHAHTRIHSYKTSEVAPLKLPYTRVTRRANPADWRRWTAADPGGVSRVSGHPPLWLRCPFSKRTYFQFTCCFSWTGCFSIHEEDEAGTKSDSFVEAVKQADGGSGSGNMASDIVQANTLGRIFDNLNWHGYS